MACTAHQVTLGLLLLNALRIAYGEDVRATVLPPEVERKLTWLPEDTETVVVAQSFPIPSMKARNANAGKPPESEFDFTMQLTALDGLFHVDDGKHLESLAGKKVVLAMRGARNYDVVSNFGSLRSESCVIVVLENALDHGWLGRVHDGSKSVRQIAHRDVFVFPSTDVMEPWVKEKPWQGTFITVLQRNTLLCATSDGYLEEVLNRLDTKPAGHALSSDLPEWRLFDPKDSYWLLRHIPRGGGRITGLTLSAKDDGFQVAYLPRPKSEETTESQAREYWKPIGLGSPPDVRKRKDGAVVVSSNVDKPFIWQLYHLQGENGNFGKQ